ncbi:MULTISPECIES: DUF2865 domain-containing protein [Methylosinus]|uniref:DUF2865 domain-containing protein n=1 Tax=Methylosinus trichosporium (strain ATCC 35070 / NCIMB 11131 / UNIQEM 75 / OB3b) TaxID=595536 RepID=A0A2D2D0G2_METT3|nr:MULTISPECIES: DUF2865 domain-containing protein [Methylosinus]ATQ68452.1 DUF2865 domain-containing protein [Methylosinus trichosporium OB3b]OBS51313.1 hypothetical protein A8B73_16605 [Methylosinus sp. 3S-1]
MARNDTTRCGAGPRAALFAASLALAAVAATPARGQNAYCDGLRAQIANAGAAPGAARYRAAAAKQQQEIDRTAAYGRSIGCDRQQFLFFGDAPPPQCGVIHRRIAQMQANLGQLMRAGGDGQRQALMARYDQQCRQRVAARPRTFLDDLFGEQEEEPQPMREDPRSREEDEESQTRHGLGGSTAICVRACDGGFFPLSYSARRANLEALSELCKAQCPNTEVELYTRSPWRELDQAVSLEGKPYSEHPNALKFAKSFDPACSCKAPGKSWAETLEEAERILAEKNKDEVVTAERAEQLSRPLATPAPRPTPASEPTPHRARETYREVVGADGVKRRVRVVAPML